MGWWRGRWEGPGSRLGGIREKITGRRKRVRRCKNVMIGGELTGVGNSTLLSQQREQLTNHHSLASPSTPDSHGSHGLKGDLDKIPQLQNCWHFAVGPSCVSQEV